MSEMPCCMFAVRHLLKIAEMDMSYSKSSVHMCQEDNFSLSLTFFYWTLVNIDHEKITNFFIGNLCRCQCFCAVQLS